ncbi:hypothetical protein BN1723_016968, partial [Verticillium longisporum]
MLTNLCRTCRFEKAYLFDVLSKIYIATDSAAADMAAYEICSDYIDVIIDITDVYGSWNRSDAQRQRIEGEPWNAKVEDQVACNWAESCMVLHDAGRPIMLREVDRYLALVWDFPGQIDIFENPTYDMEAIFGEIGALIWVIDAQDDYLEAVQRLNTTILNLQRSYPNINIEVFIHKVDGLSDDYKLDIQAYAVSHKAPARQS